MAWKHSHAKADPPKQADAADSPDEVPAVPKIRCVCGFEGTLGLRSDGVLEASAEFKEHVQTCERAGSVRGTVLDVLPPLGNPAKTYPVELTEPEIIAIHAVFGYMESSIKMGQVLAESSTQSPGFAAAQQMTSRWWNHYRDCLKGLSDRLAAFDD